MTCDFATATSAELAAAVEDAVSVLGRVDILVNNAGTIRRAPAVAYAESDWDDVLAVEPRRGLPPLAGGRPSS